MAEKQFTDQWIVPTLTELVGAEQITALSTATGTKDSWWESVVAKGISTDEQVLGTLAKKYKLKVTDCADSERAARDIVPEQSAKRFKILPLRVTDSWLEIATSNPFDLDTEKALAFATGREVRILLASPSKIREKIEELYRPENVIGKLLENMQSDAEVTQIQEQADADELQISAEEASQRPVVRLVDLILSEGILSRASDIHIEPEEGGVAVRYRIDGVLRQVMKVPRAAGLPLVSRIKIISSMDIADRLRPQDGRSRVAVNGVPVDLRVSTLPAALGEKVVIRVLDSRRTVLSLDSIGLSTDEHNSIKTLLENKDGMLLVTGPTGSGKTTTLYSCIRHVQSEGTNIVTVEDPVEYRLQGIVQVQVNEKAGLTFGSALRSILRQDPDVVLVGEIRDKETAQIAIQASLTGHLVLSTLHTNDAPNAVTRLTDIGVEGYKIATALRGVVAQRLMRRLCPTCKEVWVEAIPAKLHQWLPPGTPVYRSAGCAECSMTGYRGRFSIVEVLTNTSEVERRIGAGETADRIAEAAKAGGMKSLWDSGLQHVLKGESTIDELLRVVDVPQDQNERRSGTHARPSLSTPAVQDGKPAGRSSAAVVAPPRISDRHRAADGAAPPPSAAEDLAVKFDLLDSAHPPDKSTGRLEPLATVLLVDDEDQLRRVMKDLLEREGYRVAEAQNGIEALDQVDRHAPDIIVLDLNLPGLDGYGVLSHLRSRPATAKIPVVVLTARGDEDNEVRVLELGADDFLSKPFRARALSARLKTILGRRYGRSTHQ